MQEFLSISGANAHTQKPITALVGRFALHWYKAATENHSGSRTKLAKILSRKERKERIDFKNSRTSSTPPHLRVRFFRASRNPIYQLFSFCPLFYH